MPNHSFKFQADLRSRKVGMNATGWGILAVVVMLVSVLAYLIAA
jgi:hypothetical protein